MLGSEQASRLLVCFALLLAHVVLSLRDVLASGPRHSAAVFWQQLERWCHAARPWIQSLVTRHHENRAAEEDDAAKAMAKLVVDAVQQRKETVRRAFCSHALHAASVFVVMTALNILWGEGSKVSSPAFTIYCTSYLLLCLNSHCPGTRSWQSSRLLIAACVLAVQLLVGLTQDFVWMIIFRFAIAMPVRIAGSIVVLDTPFVCVGNALSTALFAITIYRAGNADGLTISRVHICLADVVATLFICACSRFFEDHVITSCRHAIELKASKNDAYAAAKVLNAMCDAVVHLDEHLRVAAETSLAALLLHGRGCIQAGAEFLQYLHNGNEEQAFRDWLKASPSRCEERVAFETRLRDSTGNAIAVEIFNVPFETITGASRYFLGIREKLAGNAYPDDGRLADDGLAALHGFAGTARRPRRVRTPSPQATQGAGTPASSDSPSLSGSESMPGVQEIDSCAVFQFDAAELDILGYSPGFAFGRHRPPPRGSNLIEELPHCDVNMEFLRSYDESAQALIRRSRVSLNPVEVEFHSTMVFDCSGDRFQVNVNVKMNASWPPGADPGDQQQLPRAVGTAKVLCVVPVQDRSMSAAAIGRREPLQL